MARLTRLLLALVLGAVLSIPSAVAQGTVTQPIQGAYPDVYIVSGRAIDVLGDPVVGGDVTIELSAPGVTTRPLDATTNCYGDYITYFDLRHVDPKAIVKLTLHGLNGGPDANAAAGLDPFWRRTDVNLTYQGQWSTGGCPGQTNLWGQRVTITGRLLNRTTPYVVAGESYQAIPYLGQIRVRYWPDANTSLCPPSDQPGLCDPVNVDRRGDFRYSWIAPKPIDATGRVQIVWGNSSANATVDPKLRYALAMIEGTGQGPPPRVANAPAPQLAATLAVVAASALAGARLLAPARRRP